mmetsp:Transcript_3314/g.5019  ORF Transcript_3314/g.5019 Transcript_3314/m.5019 type:complete len:386 (-) Transcript_3314:192-1349(-)
MGKTGARESNWTCINVGQASLILIVAVVMFYDIFDRGSSTAGAATSNSATSESETYPPVHKDARLSLLPANSLLNTYLNHCLRCDIADAVVDSATNALSFPDNEINVFPGCFHLRSFHDRHALYKQIFEKFDSFWVSYMGDSRIREPFYSMFDLISGQKYTYRGDAYSESRYFCCFDPLDVSNCYFRIGTIHFNGSLAQEINQQFTEASPSTHQSIRKGFCISWESKRLPSDMASAVTEQSDAALAINPSAYVMDPGIFSVGVEWQGTGRYKQSMAQLIDTLVSVKRRQRDLKIIIHGLGATNDVKCVDNNMPQFVMRWVDRYDPVLKDAIRPWKGVVFFHNLYRYTRFSPRTWAGDCVHWNGDYFLLLNHLDLNALLDEKCIDF